MNAGGANTVEEHVKALEEVFSLPKPALRPFSIVDPICADRKANGYWLPHGYVACEFGRVIAAVGEDMEPLHEYLLVVCAAALPYIVTVTRHKMVDRVIRSTRLEASEVQALNVDLFVEQMSALLDANRQFGLPGIGIYEGSLAKIRSAGIELLPD